MKTDELHAVDSRELREIANGLKTDAKALFHHNKTEAMRLFRLFIRITEELHRRWNPAVAYRWN